MAKQEMFTRAQIQEITGIDSRRIALLAEQKVIEPDEWTGEGRGSRVLYGLQKVLEFDIAASLSDTSTAYVRTYLDELRKAPDIYSLAITSEEVLAGKPHWALIRPPGQPVRLVYESNDARVEESTKARLAGLPFVEIGVGLIAHHLLQDVEKYQAASPRARRDGTWRDNAHVESVAAAR